jgi:D-sedoheptulose 7-phosphate isomerase
MNPFQSYLNGLEDTLRLLPEQAVLQAVEVLHRARLEGRQVFIMGNGGSASTASHFGCDLGKNTRRADLPNFRVMPLTDNMAIFSALANDEGYENVFVQQLSSFLRPGDLVIAISCSGNSENVIRAVEYARQAGAFILTMTGYNGGRLSPLADLDLHVPSYVIEYVEDLHLMMEHLICKALREQAVPAVQLANTAAVASASELYVSK